MVRRAVLLGVLAALAAASPAAAFESPALYVRQTLANSIDHTPKGDWVPLTSAPAFAWLGGYEIGVALQDVGTTTQLQHTALQIVGVPDGQPTQPFNATPYCLGTTGAAGDIHAVAPPLQFEGSGTYTVRVSIGPASGGPLDCVAAGPATAATTGSFSVAVGIAPVVAGQPLVVRATPLAGDPFVGVQAPAPAGGEAETRCALNATVGADGSVSGTAVAPAADELPSDRVAERTFPRPGAWTCVARGYAEGVDDELSRQNHGTPWSAPLTLDVRSLFRRVQGRISLPRAARPRLRVTAEFPEAASGASARLTVRQLVGCRGRGATFRFGPSKTYLARFDAQGATFTVRRPSRTRDRGTRYYLGTLHFDGARFLLAGNDPSSVYLKVTRTGALSFVNPLAFPQCPGFSG